MPAARGRSVTLSDTRLRFQGDAFGNIRSMLKKQIIALGIYHDVQNDGHSLNARFEGAMSLIRHKHGVRVILEEWRNDDRKTFASTLVRG